MILRTFIVSGLVALHTLCMGQPTAGSMNGIPADYEIQILLRQRVDILKKSAGMVMGIVTPESDKMFAYGMRDLEAGDPVNEETIFEIGGMTRIFTNLLFAEMVARGEVNLDDPLNKYLPQRAQMPVFRGREITLVDLATQTSGLPYLPDDDRPGDSTFYGGLTIRQLHEWLTEFRIPDDPGTRWTYSDLGTGLLARALCFRMKVSYDTLLQNKILKPLKMNGTAVHVSMRNLPRLSKGYGPDLKPAPKWWMPSLEGAASIRSTPADLVKLLKIFTQKTHTAALDPAVHLMLETTRPGPGMQQGLGWLITTSQANGGLIATVGGETYGFSSFMSFNYKTGIGVVVLSNCSENQGGLGLRIVK